jgi:hypothetical protein
MMEREKQRGLAAAALPVDCKDVVRMAIKLIDAIVEVRTLICTLRDAPNVHYNLFEGCLLVSQKLLGIKNPLSAFVEKTLRNHLISFAEAPAD